MRHPKLGIWLAVACFSVAIAHVAAAQSKHITAEVVSLDASTRLMVIKNPQGSRQTVELDDTVGGMGGIKAGDKVILTLRNEPGRPKVTAIVASKDQPRVETPTKPKPPLTDDAAATGARTAFEERVAALSADASQIDTLWGEFQKTCDVRSTAKYEGAREWLGIWDDTVRADTSTGFCKDLFNQIVNRGTAVNKGMESAEATVKDVLLPGTIREIRQRYSMDWERWGLAAPERLEP
jgi:hypothetical protein